MKTLTVYQAIAAELKAYKTKVVFGLPSDDLLLMKEIKNAEMEFVVTKDQRNAMFMTIGYALATNSLGVCSVGKGPAVTNCMTGLLEGSSQSAPLLIISSSTNTLMYGDKKSFQEAKQMEIVSPLTKWSHRLENAESIGWVLKKAIFLATSGTPGPVYLEIPEDIGTQTINIDRLAYYPFNLSRSVADAHYITKAQEWLLQSKKPLLLFGGGTRRIRDQEITESFSDWLGGPVFVTASGRGGFNEEHPLFCGLAGLYCPPDMHELVNDSDLIITMGSKLEETAMFGWEQNFKNKNVIQINVNEEDFNIQVESLNLLGDGELILKELMNVPTMREKDKYWMNEVSEKKLALASDVKKQLEGNGKLRVLNILNGINEHIPSNSVFVHENGLQDMWSYFYPYHALKKGQLAIVPSEQTSLGFGAAAAIGVAKALENKVVVAIVGDGAFNLFQSDLQTLLAQTRPVIYVVLKNGGYGWLEYQNRFDEGESGFIDRDFPLIKVSDSKLHIVTVEKEEQVMHAFQEAVEQYALGKSVIVECLVEVTDVPNSLKEIYGDFPVKEMCKL